MFFNALVDFARTAVSALGALGGIGGLLFLVLSIAYLFEDRNDGNLFWFVDRIDEKWNDFWRNDE